MLGIILLAHGYLGMRLFPALGLYGTGLFVGWLALLLSSLLLPLGLCQIYQPAALGRSYCLAGFNGDGAVFVLVCTLPAA